MRRVAKKIFFLVSVVAALALITAPFLQEKASAEPHPTFFWCYNCQDPVTIVLTGDINRDGWAEVVAVNRSAIICLSWDGHLLWDSIPEEGAKINCAILGDVNSSEPGVEIIVGMDSGYVYVYNALGAKVATLGPAGDEITCLARARMGNGGSTYVIEAGALDGNIYAWAEDGSRSVLNAKAEVISIVDIGDSDGDGRNEICIGTGAGGPPDRNCVKLVDVDNTGLLVELEKLQLEGAVTHLANAGDLNGDGKDDIFAGCDTGDVHAILVDASAPDLTNLWGQNLYNNAIEELFAYDVQGDSLKDALCLDSANLWALNSTDGSLLWSKSDFSGGQALFSMDIGELDISAGWEACVGDGAGVLYCFKIGGDLLWTFDTGQVPNGGGGGNINDISVADLNQDGVADVVAGSDDKFVYALLGGQEVILWLHRKESKSAYQDYLWFDPLSGDSADEEESPASTTSWWLDPPAQSRVVIDALSANICALFTEDVASAYLSITFYDENGREFATITTNVQDNIIAYQTYYFVSPAEQNILSPPYVLDQGSRFRIKITAYTPEGQNIRNISDACHIVYNYTGAPSRIDLRGANVQSIPELPPPLFPLALATSAGLAWTSDRRYRVGHKFSHVAVGTLITVVGTLCFYALSLWIYVADFSHFLLRAFKIPHGYVPRPVPAFAVKTPSGALLKAVIEWWCSGILSLLMFSMILLLSIFPIDEPLGRKLAIFALGAGVAFLWNASRIALAVASAKLVGFVMFQAVHFVMGPVLDFLWIVAVWSWGMSWMRGKHD